MKSLFGGYESVLLFVLRRKNALEMRVMEKERGVERIYLLGIFCEMGKSYRLIGVVVKPLILWGSHLC